MGVQLRPRKFLAALLCAAVLTLVQPSLTGAGGCDDPGGVGTCANNKAHSGHTIHHPGPVVVPIAPASTQQPPPKLDLAGWRAWLLTIFTGLIR